MNPGKLNKRITVIEQSKTHNSYGELEESWIDVCTLWASFSNQHGRKFFMAKQVHAELTEIVTIRYRKDILPNVRIKYGDRMLELIAPPINPGEGNRYLELLCKEVI